MLNSKNKNSPRNTRKDTEKENTEVKTAGITFTQTLKYNPVK